MKVGINSMAVKEFNPVGFVSASEIRLIELSLAEVDFIRFDIVSRAKEIAEMFGIEYTVHAPFQNSAVEHLRIKLSETRPENVKIMERVFEVCRELEAERIVVHAGDLIDNVEKSLKNVVKNLKEICKIGRDFEIALENLYTENGVRRVCETPDEIILVLENVNAENLCVTLDIGHAFITQRQRGIPIEEFFEKLDGYIKHMHVHNNYGIRDEHNPLNRGLIDFSGLKVKTDTAILEVKNGSREEIFRSLTKIIS